MTARSVAAALLVTFPLTLGAAEPPANLLRNGDFQDDWITLLPETKNHHWCYSSEFYNRRDFNPDTWFCKGSWKWVDADLPMGKRRLVLAGPDASVTQRVNWVMVNDDRTKSGFPDAGGFPEIKPQRSKQPMRLVRDLTLRVRVKGEGVAAGAGTIELALCPPGGIAMGDPMGLIVPPTVAVTAPVPAGTFASQVIELKLPAASWLAAANAAAAKDPKEAAEIAANGLVLPGTVSVSVKYKGAAGTLDVEHAEVIASDAADAPNLLPNGAFEQVDNAGYPAHWGKQQKYFYFPPGHYYIFNTWHNSTYDNRGPVTSDALVNADGGRSLKMIVAAGDEKSVSSEPIALNQTEPRLIEVTARVKTDHLHTLQIDAVDEQGHRVDGFDFIHKAPVSVGTNDWRVVRQVFRPRQPVKSLRLMLCARGINGYTLDDTGTQPQNNVAGTIWWDDVRLIEPESTTAELAARGVKPAPADQPAAAHPSLASLNLGEQLPGQNTLTAKILNPGPAGKMTLTLTLGKEKFQAAADVPAGGEAPVQLPYMLTPSPGAYTEARGKLELTGADGKSLATSEHWIGTWSSPLDLELGSLYAMPEQKMLVRMNLGLSSASMASVAKVKLDLIRRSTSQPVGSMEVPATLAAIQAQRAKIPVDLREDFTNLLLADLDLSALPVQPFNDPQRNWFVRATVLDTAGKPLGTADSQPFCRLAHDPPQPAVGSVRIDDHNLLYVNDKPWMPWGVIYGHVPVYPGPADPGAGKYRDLGNLPEWSIYDGFGASTYNRPVYDFNCMRYVPTYDATTNVKQQEAVNDLWQKQNLYCSTFFMVPAPGAYTPAELTTKAGGADKLAQFMAFVKSSPAVVSSGPGIEEAFGLFINLKPEQLIGLEQVAAALRAGTGKPVMVGHGGYWTPFEFEKATFFDIFDPETEPFYPASLHTDLMPLIRGKAKAVWLRPQMYEDVPYERWRFHVFVELMRGCRGWQIAHGPGDASTFRGLHAEMEFMKPIAYSTDAGPAVKIEPEVEHWSRRYNGKTYIIAATTRGLPFGTWRWGESSDAKAGRPRVTQGADEFRSEANAYGADGNPVDSGPAVHGIQWLPDVRAWPAGSKLVQWVRTDAKQPPKNLVVLAKSNARWAKAASWGTFDMKTVRDDPARAFWFHQTFYRHSPGYLGWGKDLLDKAKQYLPADAIAIGAVPTPGQWVKLEVPLDQIAAPGLLVDGFAFMHEAGRVEWGHTSVTTPDGITHEIWGDEVGTPLASLAKTRVHVDGAKAGTKVRVVFEDRELTAGADGSFTDDLRGQDLYERFGGSSGYGDKPIALRVYEVPN